MQCHSQPVMGNSDETAFHKMFNVTHMLMVVGKDVMRMSSQNVDCHSQPVDHREDV